MTQKLIKIYLILLLMILYFEMRKANLYQELVKIHNVTSINKSHNFIKKKNSFKKF